MKKIFLFLIIFLMLILISCKEDSPIPQVPFCRLTIRNETGYGKVLWRMYKSNDTSFHSLIDDYTENIFIGRVDIDTDYTFEFYAVGEKIYKVEDNRLTEAIEVFASTSFVFRINNTKDHQIVLRMNGTDIEYIIEETNT